MGQPDIMKIINKKNRIIGYYICNIKCAPITSFSEHFSLTTWNICTLKFPVRNGQKNYSEQVMLEKKGLGAGNLKC